MEIVYARSMVPLAEGRKYQNPRFFTEPLAGASKVYLTEDLPKIADAYRAVGVEVIEVNAEPVSVYEPPTEAPMSDDERAKVYVPDNWRDLPWAKPVDAGLTLRGLAAVFADEPVINKAQAIEAIEAELGRREPA